MPLSKSEQIFFREALNAGSPKPFITSIIWMARKMNIVLNFMELQELSFELDNYLLEGKHPDRRSSKE